jgi:hypothetical protein
MVQSVPAVSIDIYPAVCRNRYSVFSQIFINIIPGSMGMHMIKIKRVYAESSIDDGYRILIDRLSPWGIRRIKMKNIIMQLF